MFLHKTCGNIFEKFAKSDVGVPLCPQCGAQLDNQPSCHRDIQRLPKNIEGNALFGNNNRTGAPQAFSLNEAQTKFLVRKGYNSTLKGYMADDISDDDWKALYALA